MWPDVDLKKREISGFILNLRYINTAEWKKPDIVIKEIIMIFANYNNITFSHSDQILNLKELIGLIFTAQTYLPNMVLKALKMMVLSKILMFKS